MIQFSFLYLQVNKHFPESSSTLTGPPFIFNFHFNFLHNNVTMFNILRQLEYGAEEFSFISIYKGYFLL